MTNDSKRGPGIHHIALRAQDFEATVRFYEALGMVNAYQWGAGDGRYALMDTGDGNHIEVIAGGGESGEGALPHVALRTDSANEMYRRALEAGATSHVEPKNVELAGRGPLSQGDVKIRIAFVRGLNGEIIEFFENDVL